MLLIAYGTVVRNRFGANFSPITCPSCNTTLPSRRTPQNMRQFWWGGGYCPNCGAEVDKWGRMLSPPMPGRSQPPPPTEYSMTRLVILMSVVGFGVRLPLEFLDGETPVLLVHWIALIAYTLFSSVLFSVFLAFAFKSIQRYIPKAVVVTRPTIVHPTPQASLACFCRRASEYWAIVRGPNLSASPIAS